MRGFEKIRYIMMIFIEESFQIRSFSTVGFSGVC